MNVLCYATLFVDPEASCRITLNGFPLLDGPRPAQGQWMDIVDPFLMGANELLVEVAGPSPETDVTAEFRLTLHHEAEDVGPATGQPVVVDLRQMQAGAALPLQAGPDGVFALTGRGFLRAVGRFASHGPDFTASLRPAPPVDPAEAVALAASALDSLGRGDVDSVLALMRPLLEDMAQAWGDPVASVRAAYAAMLAEVSAARRTSPPDLTAVPFGPLVEVRRDGGPLFRSADGQTTAPAIFGRSGGAVGIIR